MYLTKIFKKTFMLPIFEKSFKQFENYIPKCIYYCVYWRIKFFNIFNVWKNSAKFNVSKTNVELYIELNWFYWLKFLFHIIHTNKEYFKSQLLQLVQNDNGECWKSTTSRVIVELHSFYKEFWKVLCQQASSLF